MVKQGENGELMVVSRKDVNNYITKRKEDNEKSSDPVVEPQVVEQQVVEQQVEQKKEGIEVVSSKSLSEKEDTTEEDFPMPQDEECEVVEQAPLKEGFTITSLASTKEESKVECPIDKIKESMKEAGLEDILTDEEDALVDGYIERTKVAESTSKPSMERVFINKEDVKVVDKEEVNVREEAVSILSKFKEYVTSTKFDAKCESAAEKHGVDKTIVKSKVVAGFLGTIANTLGLTLTISADVIMSAVNFVAYVINKVIEFAVDNLKKVITLLTLNCGEIQ